ncbi:hypothetical protein KSP39_PZI014336 [Platanthera zijinensis]|uniref:Uncharacterized protein n=1 Tax=Platanthera zijinensis TaxID=2320716 RepID=A0AAP0B9Z5_9ASPA
MARYERQQALQLLVPYLPKPICVPSRGRDRDSWNPDLGSPLILKLSNPLTKLPAIDDLNYKLSTGVGEEDDLENRLKGLQDVSVFSFVLLVLSPCLENVLCTFGGLSASSIGAWVVCMLRNRSGDPDDTGTLCKITGLTTHNHWSYATDRAHYIPIFPSSVLTIARSLDLLCTTIGRVLGIVRSVLFIFLVLPG